MTLSFKDLWAHSFPVLLGQPDNCSEKDKSLRAQYIITKKYPPIPQGIGVGIVVQL